MVRERVRTWPSLAGQVKLEVSATSVAQRITRGPWSFSYGHPVLITESNLQSYFRLRSQQARFPLFFLTGTAALAPLHLAITWFVGAYHEEDSKISAEDVNDYHAPEEVTMIFGPSTSGTWLGSKPVVLSLTCTRSQSTAKRSKVVTNTTRPR